MTDAKAQAVKRLGVFAKPDERHEFLIHRDGGLSPGAKQIPRLRDHIDALPENSATFRLTMFDDIKVQSLSRYHLEFLHSWPLHDIHGTSGPRTFVNQNYDGSHLYTDIVTRCECGTLLTRNYEDEHNAIRNEHHHFADCLPQYRLRARADMTEQRFTLLFRLGKLGWNGAMMAPRFGVGESSMASFANQFNTDLSEVYSQYKLIAANTYTYLVQECGVPAGDVADVYGHARSTMTRWAKQYSEYESSRGRNQFTGGSES